MSQQRLTMLRYVLVLAVMAVAALVVGGRLTAAHPAESVASPGAAAQAPTTAATYRGVLPVVHFDVSPPLRDIPPAALPAGSSGDRPDPGPLGGKFGPQDKDTVVQSLFGALSIPTPIISFNGPPNLCNCSPPDPNGEVGPNHYVVMDNLHYQVFNKSGTSVFGPVAANTLWAGFGGACQAQNAGDPVVLYDQLADRWLLTQFTSAVAGGLFYNCIALSTGPDPTGTYYRWAFNTGNNFPDYPKYGMWPNAYLISTREFVGGSGGPFAGVGAYAGDRAQMIAGNPNPTVISFIAPPGNQPYNVGDGLLPSDLDGTTLPPAGSPAYYMGSMDNGGAYGAPQDALTLWKFNADFSNPPASSFTLANTIPISPYDTILDACGGGRNCVPQPGTTNRLDHQGYRQRPLFRLAYRNFGDHESLVTNQSIEASAISGIRWWEVRSPNSSPQLFQDGTYAPGVTDGIHRWMGSAAMDRQGNLALGYSASSSTVFPSLYYTGRLVTDPINTLPQGEGHIVDGTGSQTGSQRWGDYSDLTVDPVDDCTFWFVSEYVPTTSATGWQIRVGAFKFTQCQQGTPTPTVTGTPPTATRTSTATITAIPSNTPSRTVTANPCQVGNYTITQSTGATVVPATTFVAGSNCDDCSSAIALPFPFRLYDQTFTTVNAISNGNLQFLSADTAYTNTCLPDAAANYAIFPHWDDLLLTGANQGIYTLVEGVAPNRIFDIEWRGGYFSGGGTVDFEVRLMESGSFEIVYGTVTQTGTSATIGVQRGTGSAFTQFSCNTASLSAGLKLTFSPPSCGTGTATVVTTPTRTMTPGGATATACAPGGPTTFQGTLAAGDATMAQRLFRDAIVGTCAAPKTYPGISSATPPYYYDTYSVANTTGATVCVTVDLTALTCNAQLTLYLNSFDPTNLATNYLNDPGSSTGTGGTVTTSANVPNGATLVIVVNDPNGTTGCGPYTVTVTGLSSGGNCPSPTVPVATSTRTVVASPTQQVGATATCVPIPIAPYTIGLGGAKGNPVIINNRPGPFSLHASKADGSAGTTSDGPSGWNPKAPISFILDDGAQEDSVGLNNGSVSYPAIWLNQFSPAAGDYPLALNQISIQFPGATSAGRNLVGLTVDLLVYLDSDADGDPSNATKLTQQPVVVTVADGSTFNNFPVNVVVAGPGDLYIGFADTYNSGGQSPVSFPSPLDTTASQGRSWVAAQSTNADPDYDNLGANDLIGVIDDFGLAGNWVIRATGNTGVVGCGTAVPTVPPTQQATSTRTATVAASATRTNVVPSATAVGTVTPCAAQFQDVPASDPFYVFIRCLVCRGIISGYTCGGVGEPCVPPTNYPYFRTSNPVTRAQTAKIVANSATLGGPVPSTQQTFADVPVSHPFWVFIERLAAFGYISGYGCGGPGEPCDAQNRPYFRPNNPVTRGQLSKIVSNAAQFNDPIPSTQQTFEDVPMSNPFWLWIERVALHGAISGYGCGGPGEPCGPGNRPYFRPGAPSTRGQTAKIDATAFFPGCQTP